MKSKSKENDILVVCLICLGLLFISVKTFFRHTQDIKEFFYHELPPWLLLVISTGIIIYGAIRYGIFLYREAKERWDKDAVEDEERGKQEQKERNERIDENLRSELHNLAITSKHLFTGDNTIERKNALQNVLNLAKSERYQREGIIKDKIALITTFKQAIREIDNSLHIEEKRREEDEEQILESEGYKKGYFKKQGLPDEAIKLLLEEGFIEKKCQSLDGTTPTYMLKPRENESPEHLFLVREVEDYLKDKVTEIQTPNSREADIIFEINNQKWAVEVETGNYPKSKPQEFSAKVAKNNKDYETRWVFLVSHRDLLPVYKKYNEKTFNRGQIINYLEQIYTDNTEKQHAQK